MNGASNLEPRGTVSNVRFVTLQADLNGCRRLRKELDSIEKVAVLSARVEGWSWQRIGDALGRSKQAVWQKYKEPT